MMGQNNIFSATSTIVRYLIGFGPSDLHNKMAMFPAVAMECANVLLPIQTVGSAEAAARNEKNV